MSSKINVETFVAVLKKSGLIEADRLQRMIADYTSQGGSPDDSPKLADFLVANGVITRWQSEKLLQGKHKGYFLGKYRLLSLLGKGGMSSVYLAEHVLMRRRCALKVLPTKRVHDSSYLARFHREAQAVASLDHPNIVRAYDVDHQDDRDTQIHFLVMEYVEGNSLQELVQKQGICGFCDAAEYIRQAALGLEHAHEAGMVHRDVKPGNLLVDPNGVVKVLDLGLARFFTGDEDEDALTLRHDEKVLGTADYLAPEQALDSHTVDARADIYALGCTLYFLLTGRPPFTEGTLAQRLMAHQTKTPPSVESLRPETPSSLAVILRKMMAKKPEERYATAKDAADALFVWIDANADPDWRRSHSGIFGPRTTESSANVPVAKPVVALPVAAMPASIPQQFVPPPVASVPVTENAELNNFFATLSDSQTGIARPAPAAAPPQSTIVSAAAPPHLKPPSSSKLKSPILPAADAGTTFPDFSAMSATTTPVLSKTAPTLKAPKSATRAPAQPKGSKLPLPVPILAGIGGGGLVLLLLACYAFGLFGGRSTGGQQGNSGASVAWTPDKREVTVGDQGEFKTIIDALKAVRRHFEPNGEPNDQMVIKIAPGTYHENISIDGTIHRVGKHKKTDKTVDPDWPQGIKLLADGDVILEPDDDKPAIRLKNIQKFVVEGITVNARSVGVELTGDMNDSRLSGMKVAGFTQVGIACIGARGISFGNSQLVLEKLTIEPATGSTTAIGIRMQSGSEGDPSDTIVRNCRLMGPLSAGIAISGTGPYRITISETIFARAQEAIRFEGAVQWKDIAILNNTMYEGRHGIVFANMPSDGSNGLVFRRNLFVKLSGAEAVIQAGYNEARFATMLATDRPGWEFNFSDRPKPATPQTGEISPLCDTNGKRGDPGITFVSTDPANAKFLAPAENAVQRSVPGPRDGEKEWVGAVGPR
ncbi:MAG: protein kinase [Planctomycetes bacterium]|nr:protein kinase [Planctomycetota bacterium]